MEVTTPALEVRVGKPEWRLMDAGALTSGVCWDTSLQLQQQRFKDAGFTCDGLPCFFHQILRFYYRRLQTSGRPKSMNWSKTIQYIVDTALPKNYKCSNIREHRRSGGKHRRSGVRRASTEWGRASTEWAEHRRSGVRRASTEGGEESIYGVGESMRNLLNWDSNLYPMSCRPSTLSTINKYFICPAAAHNSSRVLLLICRVPLEDRLQWSAPSPSTPVEQTYLKGSRDWRIRQNYE